MNTTAKAPKLDRLDKAIALVEAGAVHLVGRGSWAVQGSRGDFYSVVAVTFEGRTAYECNCPDSHYRTGGELNINPCKHALATALFVGFGAKAEAPKPAEPRLLGYLCPSTKHGTSDRPGQCHCNAPKKAVYAGTADSFWFQPVRNRR